jgi:1-acyl-sn-glycerol-3-phosphate acyltransferase
MQTVASVWSWFVLSLVIVVGFFLQLAVFLVTLPFDRVRRASGRFFRLMAVSFTRLNPMWSFGVDDRSKGARGPTRPTVVVSNHISNADVFLLSHLPWEMKWLGKASLFNVPFLGWSMRLAGDVPVVRGEKGSGGQALQLCAQWLAKDMPVMIFPEGTRSLDGKLQPFKDGAFRLAVETGADLLPVAVEGTREALPKHSWKFGRSKARVRVGVPIPSAGKTAERLRDEARAQILEMTGEAAVDGGARTP